MSMTLPEIAAAYARIDEVWRSATRQSKEIYLVQLAQLDTAAVADLDLQQLEVRDLVRGIRLLRGRIQLLFDRADGVGHLRQLGRLRADVDRGAGGRGAGGGADPRPAGRSAVGVDVSRWR